MGGYVITWGRNLLAAVIAGWMSWAGRSMLRLRSNWMTTWLTPSELSDVSWVTPAIWPNCRSNGAATADAMVSALAPDSVAVTWMVGKSTWGNGAIGRNGNATSPTRASADMISEGATRRRIKGSERFIASSRPSMMSGLAHWRRPTVS